MRFLDLSSWHAMMTTLLGLALFALIGVGIRVLIMQTVQQRRERMNRQINERLRTLIAAYRTLGGSFTGQLSVDPRRLRDMRVPQQDDESDDAQTESRSSERKRRTRDAVEAALADIILLGTVEQVRLASEAARDMAAGRPIKTAALVVALRAFIRRALDLGPIPDDVDIPFQGPTRAQSGGRSRGESDRSGGGGSGRGGGGGGGGAGGAGGGGGGIGGGVAGAGIGMGLGAGQGKDDGGG